MTEPISDGLNAYYAAAESWSGDRLRSEERSRRIAWRVAIGAGVIALAEACALVALLPLKTVVPYTLLVDRQTGYVQALRPLERDVIAPDQALTRSFLAQYVIARESFDIDTLKDTYNKVALWSAEDARSSYIAGMQANNPASPLALLPRQAILSTQIRSVSSLGPDTALVRYSTVRADHGTEAKQGEAWVAVVKYRFSGEAMSAEDRLVNPLGFQVVKYRRDPETIPAATETPQPTQGINSPPVSAPSPSRQAEEGGT